jgi:hypothetical protein
MCGECGSMGIDEVLSENSLWLLREQGEGEGGGGGGGGGGEREAFSVPGGW